MIGSKQILANILLAGLAVCTLGFEKDSFAQTAKKTSSNSNGSGSAERASPKDESKEDSNSVPENPFPKRFPAPSLDGGKAWLNTENEISIKDLRGKVVLLDFGRTAVSIACMCFRI